ncbi:hypothetical protein GIB67_014647, partial [Kingdonia uniflora]
YDSDGDIFITKDVGQAENGAQTGSGHQTEDIGDDNTNVEGRNFAIINKFEYYQVKNENYRLRYKCDDEKCK